MATTAQSKQIYRQFASTVPPERLGSCISCRRLVLAYGFGALKPSISFDPSGIDRVSIRSHVGVHQSKRQGFGAGQGELHACPVAKKGGSR